MCNQTGFLLRARKISTADRFRLCDRSAAPAARLAVLIWLGAFSFAGRVHTKPLPLACAVAWHRAKGQCVRAGAGGLDRIDGHGALMLRTAAAAGISTRRAGVRWKQHEAHESNLQGLWTLRERTQRSPALAN